MKQISQNYKNGSIRLENVNAPALKPGGVLVQSIFSVISSGTEGMKVKEGQLSYLGKARARPDQVKQVLKTMQQLGPMATYQKVMNRLDSLTPLGYSLSGIVTAVGSETDEFTVGQRVACAGAGYANHAEINYIPKNLVVTVPKNVSMEHAAFTTIGAIAMQGFRQSQMQLGEIACVVGLGLIGQLLVQILKAAGITVVGVDISEKRCKMAVNLGADAAGCPDDISLLSDINRFTGGHGIDCVFITAGGNSNQPVELAVKIARDRAKVIDIGKTRLDLPWKDYFEKEIDVRFSRSYGPGRYDPIYEEQGVDYPIGYVRWTEKRNMISFLDLIAANKINLNPIISQIIPFKEAEQVYQDLGEGRLDGIGYLFQYSEVRKKDNGNTLRINKNNAHIKKIDQVRLGVIGAGNYASSMLLPNIYKDENVKLVAVATTTSLSAANAARKFGIERISSHYHELLDSKDIDAVIVATRHSTHAQITADALHAGKSVFIEKPLAINFEELETIRKTIVSTGNERLQVGFNRRFSPMFQEITRFFNDIRAPKVINYRIHAGIIENNSWYLDVKEGSRFVGEAGHFFDIFSFLLNSRPLSVVSSYLQPDKPSADDSENMVVTITYEDGSVGTLQYLTQGSSRTSKEYFEIFGGGCTAIVDNFTSISTYKGNSLHRSSKGKMDKGQKDQLLSFISALQSGKEMPIPIQSIIDTTLVTLAAIESRRIGQIIQMADLWNSHT
jgi:predicted dehydrogenase/threonine dehydrogenase-like Zn-dependent dehydrogenase